MKARVALASALAVAIASSGCTRSAPDATPEGAVRLFVEKMETSTDDPRAMRDAYTSSGRARARTSKSVRNRASRGQGHRYEPYEMLAEGRFGLKFRPKTMSAHAAGDDATVDVTGDGPEERATVRCTREGPSWRVEPDLPEVAAPAKRGDGGT